MKAGDPIVLSLQLETGATDRFVRAFIYDVAGVPFAGSPRDLAHVAAGLYSDSGLIFPSDKFELRAVFKVYLDAGFTILDPEHGDSIEVYRLDTLDPALIASLNQILAGLNALVAQGVGYAIQGIVDKASDIVGEIVRLLGLSGEVSAAPEIDGLVDPVSAVVGYLEPDQTETGVV